MPSSLSFHVEQTAGLFLALAILLWLIARRLRAVTFPGALPALKLLPRLLLGAAGGCLLMELLLKFNLETNALRVCLLIACLGLCLWFARLTYLPQVLEVPPRTRRLLTGLRLTGLVLLLLLFHPGMQVEFEGRDKPTLPVVLDTSLSMSFVDTPGQPQRLRRVQNLLFGSPGVYRRLSRYYDVKLYGVDSGVRPVATPAEADALKPAGLATALAQGIKGALAQAKEQSSSGEPPTSVLVFTDGLDNTGRAVLDQVKPLGVHVDCVGVGTSAEHDSTLQDVAITDVVVPRTASRGELTRVKVLVDAVGLAGQQVQVTIEKDGKPIKSASLTLDGRRGDQEVPLEFIPEKEGRQEYVAKVSELPQERIRENNSADFSLNVREPLIKVLLFDTPRYESRWLARFIERETRFQPKILFMTESGFISQRGDVGGLDLTGFPSSPAELNLFDVFIIGSLPQTQIPPEVQARLVARVKAGAGILFLAGDRSFGLGDYQSTPLNDLFPVVMDGPSDKLVQRDFFPALMPSGQQSPILAGLQDVWAHAKDTDASRNLAHMQRFNPVREVAPGAQVLLATPPDPSDPAHSAPQPILVIKPVGQGRCAALLGEPTWPWYTLEGAQGKQSTYQRLWGQMIRWLAGEEAKERGAGSNLTVFTDRATYRPASPVTVFAYAGGENGQRLDTAVVEATVTGPNRYSTNLTLAPVPEDFGRYEIAFTPPTPGEYEVKATGTDQGKLVGDAAVKFTVGRPNLEYERFGMDEEKLRELSSGTGGTYANLGEIDRLLTHLQEESTARVVVWEIPFWSNGLFFLLVVTVFSLEWWMRKTYRLP